MYIRTSLLFLLLILFISRLGVAQTIVLDENFSDGDLTNNPEWIDLESKYIVNENNALQLSATSEESTASVFTASDAVYGKWAALIRLGFNPSSRNLSRFYLISNTPNISDSTSGYFVEIGGSSDDLKLYRADGDQKTKIIDGPDDLLNSSSVNVRVMITRDAEGNWEFWADSTGSQNFQFMGKGHDPTYSTGAYTGFLSKYTSSRSDRFEYDDIKITRVVPPLQIINAGFTDDTSLKVVFNRKVDNPEISVDNFALNEGEYPISEFIFSGLNFVEIKFQAPLESNRYLLTFRDLENNSDEVHVPLMLFGEFDQGDIKINEFMYDPAEGPEYIELINTSDKYLDLSGWMIADQSTRKAYVSDSTILNPNGLIVFVSDTAGMSHIYGESSYYRMTTSLPSLNNSGDVIKITTQNGVTADSLYYNPKLWKGDGRALERISIFTPSIYPENWQESTSKLSGSPALPNTVTLDNQPPTLENISAINGSVLELRFSERIDSSSAISFSNYDIIPSIDIQSVSPEKEIVTVYLTGSMKSGVEYSITAGGLSDIFENQITPTSKSFEYLEMRRADVLDIVINEFSFNPGSDGAPDFVELYNTSDKNIDITNWQIGDASGKAIIDKPIILKPDRYLVISGSKAFSRTLTNAIYLENFPSLNNSTEDAIHISDSSGFVIDSLYYSSNWGQPGYTLERKDPRAASADSSNWKINKSYFRNSAGKLNEHYQVDMIPPRAVFATRIDGNSVQIQFNEFIRNPKNTQVVLNGRTLSILDFDPHKGDKIFFSASIKETKSSIVSVHNLTDVKGNTNSYTEIPLAFPLENGSLVINEIMFNPIANSEDGIPDQAEYIELRNREAYAVSIEGLYLHKNPDENGKITKIKPVSSSGKWVAPGGLVLFYSDEKARFLESRIAKFFDISGVNHHPSLRINRKSLGLSAYDAIYLADSTGNAVDSVHYDKSWHNPDIRDSRGIALERISALGSSNVPSNWGSSVNSKGGTPLMKNSISQEQPDGDLPNGISLSNNPFTPDDDGHNDRLLINYKLDQPDYLIRVHIYDRYGRLVNKLADGQPAGFEGQLIWDGRKDDASRNRIGIYIIVFEAFNSSSGRNKAFKKAAVLARPLS